MPSEAVWAPTADCRCRGHDAVGEGDRVCLLGGVDARGAVGVQTVDVDAARADEPRVDRRGERGGPCCLGRCARWVAEQGGHGRRPGERVGPEDVHGRARCGCHVVAVAHLRRPVDDPVGVCRVAARQVGDESGRRVDRRPDVVGHVGHDRVEGGQGGGVAGLLEVTPHPLDVELGEVRDCALHCPRRVELTHRPVGPEAGLGTREVPQPLPTLVLVPVGAHDRLRLVRGVARELALLASRGVDELLVAGIEARVRAQCPYGVEGPVRRRERRRLDTGHPRVTGPQDDLGRGDRFTGVVDLEVAAPEERVGVERARSVSLDVGEAECGPLGAVRRGNLPVGVEEVSHVHCHRPP